MPIYTRGVIGQYFPPIMYNLYERELFWSFMKYLTNQKQLPLTQLSLSSSYGPHHTDYEQQIKSNVGPMHIHWALWYKVQECEAYYTYVTLEKPLQFIASYLDEA